MAPNGRRRRRRSGPLILLAVLLAAAPLAGVGQAPPRPPTQPASGAGGAEYAYRAVAARRVGEPPLGYWLFSPSGRTAGADVGDGRGGSLPVVLFLHGVTALDPTVYRGWIDHLVRRGAFVVYPDYHPASALAEPWSTFLPNLRRAVAAARTDLGPSGGATPDWGRLAVVGHSLGGALAAAYAADAAAGEGGRPTPVVVAIIQPGGCRGCGGLTDRGGLPLPELAAIAPTSRVLVVTADEDRVVGDEAARVIWDGLTSVPLDRRDHVRLRSDRRGDPPLVADHLLPQTAGWGSRTDALDWYGTWKLVDLLTDCAFAGRGCEEAQNGSARQRSMGFWSDGVPVAEALIDDGAFATPVPEAEPERDGDG